MPIPTVNLIQQTFGHTGGKTLVRIGGTNFRLPTTPPPGYVLGSGGTFLRSVSVTFGGVPATDVRVIKEELLTCLTPSHDPGAVDVVVQNLDDNGIAIGGETVTIVGGYSFRRPRTDKLADQDLTRVVAEVINQFKRQVIDNVAITTDTDFDPVTGDSSNYIEPANLPQIVLIGPRLKENRFYSENELPEDSTWDPVIKVRREAKTHDLTFDIMGVTDNLDQMLNLMVIVERMFHKTKFITIPKNVGSTDTVDFELDIATDGNMQNNMKANRSNVHTFQGTFLVRGVTSDDLFGFQDDLVIREDALIDTIIVESSSGVGQ